MQKLKVIITGSTGMVGEGVLFECLRNENVEEILLLNRRHYNLKHPKVREQIVPDFFRLNEVGEKTRGYDACFFCAGISSVGMKEDRYRHITYDTTLSVATTLLRYNPSISFCYVSGSHTDSSESGRLMWARIKGRTENALAKLSFKSEFNFRPGIMLPYPGQKNWKGIYKAIGNLVKVFAPKSVLNIADVGKAMINVVLKGYPKNILEIADIRKAAQL